MQELALQEQLFVDEYMVDFDPRAAAIRAGVPIAKSIRTAKKWLADENVKAALKEAMALRREQVHINADRVLEEYARVGFANIGDYVDWNAGAIVVRGKNEIPPEKRVAIQEITEQTTPQGTTIKVKLHPKLAALEALSKHLGLFDNPPEDADGQLGERLTKARQRVIEAQKRREQRKLTESQVREAEYVVDETAYDEPPELHHE